MQNDTNRFDEVWVYLPGGQSMCALINGERGWLMYLREPGDAGFSSRNPSYDGPDDEELEYELSNGQRDYYPASWALPVAEVRRALDDFQTKGRPPTFICWHNDSGDGASLAPFPVGVWGRVTGGPERGALQSIRFEPDEHGGFLVLLRQTDGEYDHWAETADDASSYLVGLEVSWPLPEE